MAIPKFNSKGFLPKGIHDATLSEIKEQFCSFGDIEKRTKLLKSLSRYIEAVKEHNVIFYICIDGSYVTEKECPGDLDVLIVYDIEYYNKKWSELISDKTAPFIFKGLQILPAVLESFGEDELLDFAQCVKDKPNLRKGIVKVIL